MSKSYHHSYHSNNQYSYTKKSNSSIFKINLKDSLINEVLPQSLVLRNYSYRQKALALLGDRLIDLKLYEQLIVKGEKNEGYMTQIRSMLVANSNLARYCHCHL